MDDFAGIFTHLGQASVVEVSFAVVAEAMAAILVEALHAGIDELFFVEAREVASRRGRSWGSR